MPEQDIKVEQDTKIDEDAKAEQARRKFIEDLYKRDEVAEDEKSMKPHQTYVKDPNAPGGIRRVRYR